MKFEDESGNIIYCKNDYREEFDNNGFSFDWNIWYYKGYLVHRKNRIAIKWNNGEGIWFLNGKTHREDGPAIE